MSKNPISLLWELPLALLSFLFYKVLKFAIGNLYTLYLMLNRKQASRWRVLSAENLKSPLSLPVLMTKGPRWNTHAIIGTLGPFTVKEKVALDTETANRSTESWIAVFYSFPAYETIATLESNQLKSATGWETLGLSAGQYSIGLRYYGWRDRVELPAVKVDGELQAEVTPVSPQVNEFYDHLSDRTNLFYASLHYYIFTILKWRKWLPEAFVKGEYLPVGSPDTQFLYGYLERGQALKIAIAPQIVNCCNLYLTIYNRASLPVGSFQIEVEEFSTEPVRENGFYLMRIRHQVGRSSEIELSSIQSRDVEQDSEMKAIKVICNS
ncbi:DUF6208 family protein [Oscillatoria sp. FACHB-1406]|uniref:DUF6208 family protein n=1 Tax=Oscillatoria sp. FACHB-1406 TaxID=2692846 RepID=UPI0016834961|nr:DUF6208 family protein [Oscillatoria sp. FACHB-1406]MBD2578916.1 hypothetical protein [Oscillatoria sp. FACHB-1406]